MTTKQELDLPPDAPLWARLRVAVRSLLVLSRDPQNPAAGDRLNLSLDRGVYTTIAAALRGGDEGRRLLDERPSMDAAELDVAALGAMPDGTLGRELARYFEHNGIGPFASPFVIRSDEAYISKRYRETHDLAHVLTAYGTDIVGEMELQAFMLGNLGIPSAALIVSFGTLSSVPKLSISLRDYARRIHAAHRRGRATRQLLALRYESLWLSPLEAVRGMLALSPLPAGHVPGRPDPAYLKPMPMGGAS